MLRRTLWLGALLASGVGCQVIGGLSSDLKLAGAGTEACADGTDNDGDELVDCEDPDCAKSTCAEGAPAGWEGPFLVTTAPWAYPEPICPAGLAEQTHFAGPAGPPECETCECGPLQGVTCSAPEMRCAPDPCGFLFGEITVQAAPGECKAQPPPSGFMSFYCEVQGDSTVQGQGSCFLTKDTELVDRAAWSDRVIVCGPIGGAGCQAGQACAPAPTLGAHYCIRGEGGAACPAGWDATSIDAFTGGTDTRTCTPCTCGAPTVTCEGYGFTVFDDETCNPMVGDAPVDVGKSCTNVSALAQDDTWSVMVKPAVPTGQCAPVGAVASGEMKPEGPIKYCCQ